MDTESHEGESDLTEVANCADFEVANESPDKE